MCYFHADSFSSDDTPPKIAQPNNLANSLIPALFVAAATNFLP